jgi:hypothetical protein
MALGVADRRAQDLPERFFADVARRTGRALDDRRGSTVAVEGPARLRF